MLLLHSETKEWLTSVKIPVLASWVITQHVLTIVEFLSKIQNLNLFYAVCVLWVVHFLLTRLSVFLSTVSFLMTPSCCIALSSSAISVDWAGEFGPPAVYLDVPKS